MPDCPDSPDSPDDYCYVVLIHHISAHISNDYRILTHSYDRACSYCSILRNAYESIQQPYIHFCQGCQTNQCQVIVKFMHVDNIWFYNNNMIYYQDIYYENGLCNADESIEFNNQDVREAIIRHGGESLVSW